MYKKVFTRNSREHCVNTPIKMSEMQRFTFTHKNVSIDDYISNVKRGKYDIDPPHQRHAFRTVKWCIDVIIHIYRYNTLTPLYYHTRSSDGLFESLDGKQRTMAMRRYINGEFEIPASSNLPACLCKKFTDLPSNLKQMFLNTEILVLTCKEQMDPNQIADFFKNVQKSSSTKVGEKINANTDNALNRMIDAETKTNGHVCLVNNNRMDEKELISKCVYMFVRCNQNFPMRTPSADVLIEFGKSFTDIAKFRTVVHVCRRVSEWMQSNDIRQTIHDFLAFFGVFAFHPYDLTTVITNIENLQDPSNWSDEYTHQVNGTGAYSRYMYILERYGKV